MDTPINKPLTMLREEFIENIQNLCNNSKLPYFVISDVLKWLIPQIDEVAVKEAARNKARYNKMVEKQQEEDENRQIPPKKTTPEEAYKCGK